MIYILCVGDSRLRHLQSYLNQNERDLYFNCHVFPGATLGFLSFQLRMILQSTTTDYSYIIVMGGICDLTIQQKENGNRRLTPAYDSVSATV